MFSSEIFLKEETTRKDPYKFFGGFLTGSDLSKSRKPIQDKAASELINNKIKTKEDSLKSMDSLVDKGNINKNKYQTYRKKFQDDLDKSKLISKRNLQIS